jgi:hypothetical protein
MQFPLVWCKILHHPHIHSRQAGTGHLHLVAARCTRLPALLRVAAAPRHGLLLLLHLRLQHGCVLRLQHGLLLCQRGVGCICCSELRARHAEQCITSRVSQKQRKSLSGTSLHNWTVSASQVPRTDNPMPMRCTDNVPAQPASPQPGQPAPPPHLLLLQHRVASIRSAHARVAAHAHVLRAHPRVAAARSTAHADAHAHAHPHAVISLATARAVAATPTPAPATPATPTTPACKTATQI